MALRPLEPNMTGIDYSLVVDGYVLTYDAATGLALFKVVSGPPGTVNIKQTEVDFGAAPVSEGTFIVTDAAVGATNQLIAQVAYEAPTSKELDEIEMDDLQIRCAPGVGQFTMHIRAADGSYLADKFKINYLIG